MLSCSSRHAFKESSYQEKLDRVSIDIAYILFAPDSHKGLSGIANHSAIFMLKEVPPLLKQSLEKRGVEVLRGNLKTPSTSKVIRLEASDMDRSCIYGTNTYNYGRLIRCDDTVWYKVSLSDREVGKVVWSSEFKADAYIYDYKRERQQKALHQFVQRIVKALSRAGLLVT